MAENAPQAPADVSRLAREHQLIKVIGILMLISLFAAIIFSLWTLIVAYRLQGECVTIKDAHKEVKNIAIAISSPSGNSAKKPCGCPDEDTSNAAVPESFIVGKATLDGPVGKFTPDGQDTLGALVGKEILLLDGSGQPVVSGVVNSASSTSLSFTVSRTYKTVDPNTKLFLAQP
jgi:hypothetical protein